MKKLFIVLIIYFLNFIGLSIAQNNKSTLFKTKEGNFLGQIEVRRCSDDILEYKLTICKEEGHPIFEQKGYALIIDLDKQIKYELDYEESIGTDAKPIYVRQYLVKSKCEKWLNIKIAKDSSIIKIDCGEDLINLISGDKPENNPKSFHLGYFYRVN